MKRVFLLSLVFLIVLVACPVSGDEVSVESQVKNDMNVVIQNLHKYTELYSLPYPGSYPMPNVDNPFFITGKVSKTHNLNIHTLLTTLALKKYWTLDEALRLIKGKKIKAESEMIIEIDQKIERRKKKPSLYKEWEWRKIQKNVLDIPSDERKSKKKILVLTSARQVFSVSGVEPLSIINVYAKKPDNKTTTSACFGASLVECARVGGNALLLILSGADREIVSGYFGIGLAYTHAYMKDTYGGSGGGGLGWAKNKAKPKYGPWIHAIALRIPQEEIQNIPPDVGLIEKVFKVKIVPKENNGNEEKVKKKTIKER